MKKSTIERKQTFFTQEDASENGTTQYDEYMASKYTPTRSRNLIQVQEELFFDQRLKAKAASKDFTTSDD